MDTDGVVTVPVQVDGRLRGTIEIAPGTSEEEIRTVALALPNVAKHLEGRVLRRFIYSVGRIVGIITAPAPPEGLN